MIWFELNTVLRWSACLQPGGPLYFWLPRKKMRRAAVRPVLAPASRQPAPRVSAIPRRPSLAFGPLQIGVTPIVVLRPCRKQRASSRPCERPHTRAWRKPYGDFPLERTCTSEWLSSDARGKTAYARRLTGIFDFYRKGAEYFWAIFGVRGLAELGFPRREDKNWRPRGVGRSGAWYEEERYGRIQIDGFREVVAEKERLKWNDDDLCCFVEKMRMSEDNLSI